MKKQMRLAAAVVAGASVLALSACNKYVKRDEFNATVAELRGEDARLRADIDALKSELQTRFQAYDARISELGGRLRVDMTTHFEYGQAALREQDRPVLDEFAKVIRERNADVVVTVEGFTDPAGSTSYNKRLGQERADAVRTYLVQNGLVAERVRSVSYGEDRNRQIVPGAYGEQGEQNRRVALVIDYVPPRG